MLEHQPVEKQYVVETRFVGEAAIPSATGELSEPAASRNAVRPEINYHSAGVLHTLQNVACIEADGNYVGG